MEMVNLKTLWKLSKSKNVPLFGTSEQLSGLNFMAGYLSDFAKFDRNTAVTRGGFAPLWNRQEEDTDDDVLAQFQEDASIVLIKNKDNLKHLYELALLEYDPIENYNRYEERHNKLSGGHTTERQGSVSETLSGGHTTDKQGSVSETLSGGHTTERQGNVKETTTPFSSIENEVKVYAYDSNSASPSEIQTERTNGKMEVETSRAGDKDIVTFDNETKVISHDGDKDVFQYNNEKKVISREGDKDVFQYNDEKNDEDSHIHGNIGVTTTQQMMESEINLWESFKFFDIIVNMILKELCTLCDNQDNIYYI